MEPPLQDASEYVGKPGQRVDIVGLRRHDQRGHGSGTVGTPFGAGEQPGRRVKLVVPVIGVGLHNAGEVAKMPDGMLVPSVPRGVIQRRRRCTTAGGTIVADEGPRLDRNAY